MLRFFSCVSLTGSIYDNLGTSLFLFAEAIFMLAVSSMIEDELFEEY